MEMRLEREGEGEGREDRKGETTIKNRIKWLKDRVHCCLSEDK